MNYIQITKFKDIFSEESETHQYKRISWRKLLNSKKSYSINVNGELFSSIDKLPKLKLGDIVTIREVPQGKSGTDYTPSNITPDPSTTESKQLTIGGSAYAVMQILNKNDQFYNQENKAEINKPFPAVYGTVQYTPRPCSNYYSLYEQVLTQEGKQDTLQYLTGLVTLGNGDIKITKIYFGDKLLIQNSNGLNNNIEISEEVCKNLFYSNKFGTPKIKFEIRKGILPPVYGEERKANSIPNKQLTAHLDQSIPYPYALDRNECEEKIPLLTSKVDIKFTYLNGLCIVHPKHGISIAKQRIVWEVYDSSGKKVLSGEFGHTGTSVNSTIYNETITLNPQVIYSKITFTILKPNPYPNYPVGPDWDIGGLSTSTKSNEYGIITQRTQPTVSMLTFTSVGKPIDFTSPNMRNLNLIGIHTQVNDISKDYVNKFHVECRRRIPIYRNGNWSSSDFSSNPAAIARHMLTGENIAEPQPISMIDDKAFGDLYIWCEQKKYTFNYVFEEDEKFFEAINKVLSVCQASILMSAGKYTVIHDKARPQPLAIICPKNSSDFTAKIDTKEPYTGARVTFFNEKQDYLKDQIEVQLIGDTQPNTRVLSLEPDGVTTYEMATKLARYILAAKRNRPESYSLKVGAEHFYFPLGSRVMVQQSSILNGLGSGRIAGVNATQNYIILDEDFDTDTTKKYGIKIELAYQAITHIEVTPTTFKHVFQTVGYSVTREMKGKFYALGEFGKETLDCIVASKSGTSSKDYSGSLELLPYSEEIFTATDKPIPEFDSGVTIGKKPISSEIYKEQENSVADDYIGIGPDGDITIGGVPGGILTDVTPPNTVESISAAPRADTSVLVSWGATIDNVGGSGLANYIIHRAEKADKSDAKQVLSVGKETLTAIDNTTKNDISYYYGVSAIDRNYNECGISWLEDPVTARYVIAPNAVTGLKAKAAKGQIELEWQAPTNAGDVTYYIIEKSIDGGDWQRLGQSGTLSYNEIIGKVEKAEILKWRYRVNAYNLYEVSGAYSNVVTPDVSKYGTYDKAVIKPQLTATIGSIFVSWERQYELMDYKEMDIGYTKKSPANWVHVKSPSFFTLNNLPFDIGSDGKPIATDYTIAIRQIAEDDTTVDWQSADTNEGTDRTVIKIYPADYHIIRADELEATKTNFTHIQAGYVKGNATDARIPVAEKLVVDGITQDNLTYIDFISGRFRFGDLTRYMFGAPGQSLLFKGTNIELGESSMITNNGNIYLKHEGDALTWGNSNFSAVYAKLSVMNDSLTSKNLYIGTSPSAVAGGVINGIQIETSRIRSDYENINHTGVLLRSGLMGGWGTAQLVVNTSNNWGSYNPNPVLTLGENEFNYKEKFRVSGNTGAVGINTAPDSAYALKVNGSITVGGIIHSRHLEGSSIGTNGELFLNWNNQQNVRLGGGIEMNKNCYIGGNVGIKTAADSRYALKVSGGINADSISTSNLFCSRFRFGVGITVAKSAGITWDHPSWMNLWFQILFSPVGSVRVPLLVSTQDVTSLNTVSLEWAVAYSAQVNQSVYIYIRSMNPFNSSSYYATRAPLDSGAVSAPLTANIYGL